MNKHKHTIQLSSKELGQIPSIIRRGRHGARVITRARILLLSYRGKSKDAIAAELEINRSTVQDVRNRYREGRLGRSLYDAPRAAAIALAAAHVNGRETHVGTIIAHRTPLV